MSQASKPLKKAVISEKKSGLKPFNAVVQVCPDCGKVDVYLNDGHDCGKYLVRNESEDFNWN